MKFENFLLRDTAGNKSSTLTVFVLGSIIVNLKLVFSGMTIGSLISASFTGSEYAMAMSALGAIYVLRRSTDPVKKEENKDGSN